MGVNVDVFIVGVGTFCPPSPSLEIQDKSRGCLQGRLSNVGAKQRRAIFICCLLQVFLARDGRSRRAIALADKGHKVRILGRQSRLQWLDSVIGIMPGGARVLEQYGVPEDVWKVHRDRRIAMNFRRWEDGSVLLSQEPAVRESPFGIW
jgi:hypothetical protein